MKNKVAGLPDMDVPGPNELRPSMTDCSPSRGPLAYVPAGVAMVHDYGAKPMGQAAYPYDYHAPTSSATSSATTNHPDAESVAKALPTTKR